MSVKKINYKLNAEIKTISDYALILQYLKGYNQEDSRQLAMKSQGDDLFDRIMQRNIELFKTGFVVMLDQ